MGRDTCKDRVSYLDLFLLRLELVPLGKDILCALCLRVAKYMRMTGYQFVYKPFHDIGYIKLTLLSGKLRVEDNLQEEVAKLLLEHIWRALVYGLNHLVCLFYQIRL